MAWVWLQLAWQLLYRSGRLPHEARWSRGLNWAFSVALGVWSTYLFFCMAADAASLAGAPAAAGAKLAAGSALVAAGLGLAEARRGPRVRRVEIKAPGLPQGLNGLKIVHLSDLHVGPTIRRAEVERAVARALELAPDLIAVTGDLVDGTVSALARDVEPLSRLRAPLGVFYVPGNHEYYWDAPSWLAKTRELGMTPLVNEALVLERGGARLLVGGVTDETGGLFVPGHEPDFEKAAAPDQAADFRLLLAHRPTGYARAERAGFDLQLSGHTHGGQFFPWSLIVPLFHRYSRGLHRHGRLNLYVSVGTGYWGPAHRLAVPAEIALLTLTRSE